MTLLARSLSKREKYFEHRCRCSGCLDHYRRAWSVPEDVPMLSSKRKQTGAWSNPEWHEYRKTVRQLTEQQDISVLPGYEERAWDGMHLDHIVPIRQGYLRKIPTRLIASIENLRFVSREKNTRKGRRLTKEGRRLLEKWGFEV